MKNVKKQKQTAKETARPKPFLNAKEVEELQYLPGKIGEVLEANHFIVNNHKTTNNLFDDLWVMIAFSWKWCEVYNDAERQELYVFLQDLIHIVDLAKKHEKALEQLDYEEMDIYYLIP